METSIISALRSLALALYTNSGERHAISITLHQDHVEAIRNEAQGFVSHAAALDDTLSNGGVIRGACEILVYPERDA